MATQTRRKLVVERAFQMRYASLFALTCFILGMVSVLALAAFARSYYVQLDRAGVFLAPSLSDVYRQGWNRVLFWLATFTVVYSGVAFWIGLVLTRNIVGPVTAFRAKIRKLLSTGKPEKFDLRSSDELTVLAEIYADVSSHVSGKKR